MHGWEAAELEAAAQNDLEVRPALEIGGLGLVERNLDDWGG